MQEKKYIAPDNSAYDTKIPKLSDAARVHASEVVNVILDKIVENTHANHVLAENVYEQAGRCIAKAEKGRSGGIAALESDGTILPEYLLRKNYSEAGSAQAVQADLQAHMTQENPHEVTYVQAGAASAGSAAKAQESLQTHLKENEKHADQLKKAKWDTTTEKAEQAMQAARQVTGMRYATITVGSAAAGHTKDEAEYLCTGQNDQEVIAQAVQSLPAVGGKIRLLEGTYNLSAQLAVNKQNAVLEGMGNSTVMNKGFSGQCILLSGAASGLRSVLIKGNKSVYSSASNNGGVYVTGARALVDGVSVQQAGGAGITLAGTGGQAAHCICQENGAEGILFAAASRESLAIENTCVNNTGYGIRSLGKGDLVFGNMLSGNKLGSIYAAPEDSKSVAYGNNDGNSPDPVPDNACELTIYVLDITGKPINGASVSGLNGFTVTRTDVNGMITGYQKTASFTTTVQYSGMPDDVRFNSQSHRVVFGTKQTITLTETGVSTLTITQNRTVKFSAGLKTLRMDLVGGGDGAPRPSHDSIRGGSPGAGGYHLRVTNAVFTPGVSYSAVIGLGGAGVAGIQRSTYFSSVSGGNGGNTTLLGYSSGNGSSTYSEAATLYDGSIGGGRGGAGAYNGYDVNSGTTIRAATDGIGNGGRGGPPDYRNTASSGRQGGGGGGGAGLNRSNIGSSSYFAGCCNSGAGGVGIIVLSFVH